jgi:putative ABC transport system substrate-binding protein
VRKSPAECDGLRGWGSGTALARPGGNLTGMSYLAIDLVGKRIEFLKEWLPDIRRMTILARPQHPGENRERQASQAAAEKVGLAISYYPFRDPPELDSIFRSVIQDHCDAIVVFPDTSMFGMVDRISKFAIDAKLPTASGWGRFAEKGSIAELRTQFTRTLPLSRALCGSYVARYKAD